MLDGSCRIQPELFGCDGQGPALGGHRLAQCCRMKQQSRNLNDSVILTQLLELVGAPGFSDSWLLFKRYKINIKASYHFECEVFSSAASGAMSNTIIPWTAFDCSAHKHC